MNIKNKLKNNVRIVTATSLFDGHDASINVMRRVIMDGGAEVIHLGHNRSAREVVDAAINEDANAVAVSCYQGGHVEFFKYIYDLLKERKADHIKIFGGGGGVIVPEEIEELHKYGITKIYSPDDGIKLGLEGMVEHMLKLCDFKIEREIDFKKIQNGNYLELAHLITKIESVQKESKKKKKELLDSVKKHIKKRKVPIIGITGTGGAGKSSLTDELLLRFFSDNKNIKIAVISCDPSRKKTGGALLGDRIRMNSLYHNENIYMRSLAVRDSSMEISKALPDVLKAVLTSNFDLIITETAGIGQGDSNIFGLTDISTYVMTSEFGAASQLEKIDMLDYADAIAINKFEKQGSEDALKYVQKQVQRNRKAFDKKLEELHIYGTIASKFNDDGVTAFYLGLLDLIKEKTKVEFKSKFEKPKQKFSSSKTIIIPTDRIRYLSEISETVRNYHKKTEEESEKIKKFEAIKNTVEAVDSNSLVKSLKQEMKKAEKLIGKDSKETLKEWEKIKETYLKDEFVYKVRDKEIKVPLYTTTLSGTKLPKVSIPKSKDLSEIYKWMRKENVAGKFPYTAGVFPFKRTDEDPTRMFAGEGDAKRTNTRFKLLSENYPAKRLSTAFDSPTLYGFDPDLRPDIYGKVGNSGVSICTIEDIKELYKGFDLSAPNNSVSMTINGPAPIMLAMFLNAAISQKEDEFQKSKKRKPNKKEAKEIKDFVFANVRGTVQADILKEDQGQNTCIFSIDFALKMMGDIQEFFIEKNIKNFYSVSISGYHIAEAGANPISQLAFTMSNAFTFVEYYLSRGIPIDKFAPNLSFFFSSGMDPEYTVLGRVARRVWAIALKEKYGANVRSQLLKYHIQTSGRSLHSKNIQFNDIRTTLQALSAIYDNCNSLHTNSYDEAITTPTEESVRRAIAIQLIINREWGLNKNENISQGSFIMEELTDLVEEALLNKFDEITRRGGVLGAMETGYQRSSIQEESMLYEHLKHSGEYPIIGVNTFIKDDDEELKKIELARAEETEKQSQLERLKKFHKANETKAKEYLKNLKKIAMEGGNVFEELMETVKYASLGQIVSALYEVGGQYRRNL